jgi:Domain of Unknown Function (DUF1521)
MSSKIGGYQHAAHVDRSGNVDTGRYDIKVRNTFGLSFAEVRDERTGRVVDRIFDGQSERLPDGTKVRFEADRDGQEITVRDESGHVDRFTRAGGHDDWDRDHVRGGDRDCRPSYPSKPGDDFDRGQIWGGPYRPGGNDCNCNDGGKGFAVDECNNTVDTGRYLISASGDRDGELKVYDKYTGQYVTAWGDPHLDTSDGDKATFNKTFTLNLPDGTKVTINTTGGENSYLQKATITTKDGQAAVIRYDGDHNPSTEELHGVAARTADWRTPDGGRVYTRGGNLDDLTFGRWGPELKGDEGNIDDELALTQRRQFSPYWGS